MGKKETTPFSVGVISGYNPEGIETNPKANREAQRMLKSEIEKLNLKFVERDGTYLGHREKFLVIRNISRRELVRLCDQFRQAAVMYGETDGGVYNFEWIEDGKTLSRKKTPAEWPVKLPKFPHGVED